MATPKRNKRSGPASARANTDERDRVKHAKAGRRETRVAAPPHVWVVFDDDHDVYLFRSRQRALDAAQYWNKAGFGKNVAAKYIRADK